MVSAPDRRLPLDLDRVCGDVDLMREILRWIRREIKAYIRLEMRARTREAMEDVVHFDGEEGWMERDMTVLSAPRAQARRQGLWVM